MNILEFDHECRINGLDYSLTFLNGSEEYQLTISSGEFSITEEFTHKNFQVALNIFWEEWEIETDRKDKEELYEVRNQIMSHEKSIQKLQDSIMTCNECKEESLKVNNRDSSVCDKCLKKDSPSGNNSNLVIKGKVDKETAIRLMLRACDWSHISDYAGRDECHRSNCEEKYEAAKYGDVLCEFKG